MDDKSYIATVQKTFASGRHGPYAKASSEIGTITFSQEPPVWKEERKPEEGDTVVLSDVRKKRAGWRAESGRFFRPFDEKTQQSGEDKR